MARRVVTAMIVSGLLVLVAAALASGPAMAQANEGIGALKGEIEALKQGQAAMRKDLEEIKKLLRRRPGARPSARRQAPAFEPLELGIAGAPFKGKADAPVTLVEFTDYQCPFCRRHFQSVMPRIEKDYVETGKVKYVMREFPIRGLHPDAPKAAEAALCAGDQGAYWAMHDLIFENPKQVRTADLEARAKRLALDGAAFSDCLATGKYRDRVRADIADGAKAGVRGTPSFFLGMTDPNDPGKIKATKMIRGAQGYETFKQAIDQLLKQPS